MEILPIIAHPVAPKIINSYQYCGSFNISCPGIRVSKLVTIQAKNVPHKIDIDCKNRALLLLLLFPEFVERFPSSDMNVVSWFVWYTSTGTGTMPCVWRCSRDLIIETNWNSCVTKTKYYKCQNTHTTSAIYLDISTMYYMLLLYSWLTFKICTISMVHIYCRRDRQTVVLTKRRGFDSSLLSYIILRCTTMYLSHYKQLYWL